MSIPESIDTLAGVAALVSVEVEDENGDWNDDWYTRDGYYVVHVGPEHRVYEVRRGA